MFTVSFWAGSCDLVQVRFAECGTSWRSTIWHGVWSGGPEARRFLACAGFQVSMASQRPDIERELSDRVEELGYELVEFVWAGSRARPILRVKVDHPVDEGRVIGGESEPYKATVTVDDCAKVSRGLEGWLDEMESLSVRYTLEVSSPGVDRPLTKARDFRLFAGQPVAVTCKRSLDGRPARLEGTLVGLDEPGEKDDSEESNADSLIRIELSDGEEVEIPLELVKSARLVFKW